MVRPTPGRKAPPAPPMPVRPATKPGECWLNDQERRAVNEFLAERWAEFTVHASKFLDEDECSELEDKLAGNA